MRPFIAAVCLFVAGCGQLVEQTRTLDEKPGILVQGAPDAAVLRIDGLTAGAIHIDGGRPQAIRVEPGTHVIEVVVHGQPILNERVFVSGAMIKTLTIPAEGR